MKNFLFPAGFVMCSGNLLKIIIFAFSYLKSNSEIHNINTRFSSDLHTATENLTNFQKLPGRRTTTCMEE